MLYFVTIRTYYDGITSDFYTDNDYIFKDRESLDTWYKNNKHRYTGHIQRIVKRGRIDFNQWGILTERYKLNGKT